MFKSLLKIKLCAFFASTFKNIQGKSRKGKNILGAVLIIYLLAVFGWMFRQFFDALCEPICAMGLEWTYFALAGILSFGFVFFFTIFVGKTQLFEAKDNELLLAMPIPPSYILASRMTALLVLAYIYELTILVPAGIVYFTYQPMDIFKLLILMIAVIVMPFLALTFSNLAAWLIAAISSRMKRKSAFTVISSLVFFGIYMAVLMRMQTYISEIIAYGNQIADTIQKILLPFYYMGNAIAQKEISSLILMIVSAIVPFGIVYGILAKNFIGISTTNKGAKKIKYEEKSMKKRSIRTSFIQKEINRFTSSPIYMLNAGLGLIAAPILGIAVLIKKDAIMQMFLQVPEIEAYAGAYAVIALSLLSASIFISSPSISLEGKNIWILKNLPIRAYDIVCAKAETQMVISFPFLIVSAALCRIAFPMNTIQTISLFLIPMGMNIISAYLGVLVNLYFPKMDWGNEAAAVKQSMAPLITGIGMETFVVLIGAAYIFIFMKFVSVDRYMAICIILIAVITMVLIKILKKKSDYLFQKL